MKILEDHDMDQVGIIDYLSQMIQITSARQRRFYSAIYHNGKHYGPAVEGYNYEDYETTIKACFSNSLGAWMENNDFQYVEGFYITKGIPLTLEHAWNVSKKSGNVYDFTSVPNNIPVLERFGVKISDEDLFTFLSSDHVGTITPLQFIARERRGIFKNID